MTKEQRKRLRSKIIDGVEEMTAGMGNRESSVMIGGHRIQWRLVYAGGSQWAGSAYAWDNVDKAWAWVVDERHCLTFPDLFGFDGHNTIELQTGYYLMAGYDEHGALPADGNGNDPLTRVPGSILLEIGRALVAAIDERRVETARQAEEAERILEKLEERNKSV